MASLDISSCIEGIHERIKQSIRSCPKANNGSATIGIMPRGEKPEKAHAVYRRGLFSLLLFKGVKGLLWLTFVSIKDSNPAVLRVT